MSSDENREIEINTADLKTTRIGQTGSSYVFDYNIDDDIDAAGVTDLVDVYDDWTKSTYNATISIAHCKICHQTIVISSLADKDNVLCPNCEALHIKPTEECTICHKPYHPLINVGTSIKACFDCLSDIRFKEMYNGDSAVYARTEEAISEEEISSLGIFSDNDKSMVNRDLDDVYMSTMQGQRIPVYDMFRILCDLDVVVSGDKAEDTKAQEIVNKLNTTVPISKENQFYSVKVTKGKRSLTEALIMPDAEEARMQIYLSLQSDGADFVDDIYDKITAGEFISLEQFDSIINYIGDDVIISMGDPRFFNIK